MNNEQLIVEERSRDIGNFLVGRLLPFARKRQVGPFTFIDHMGPSTIGPGRYMDVDQHPHIGLSTLTYLLEGEIHHRDSTGADAIVGPRDVGFMTSGRGVTHVERTPAHLRDGQESSVHGYQVWVAMPQDKEEMAPRFDFVASADLPRWPEGGIEMTLVAGEGYGRKSPLPVHSPLFMIEAYAPEGCSLDIAGQVSGELAVVVVEGEVADGAEQIKAGQMLVSKTDDHCHLQLSSGCRLLLFGGRPLDGERLLRWNFVSHSNARLDEAEALWRAKGFPKVAGDETYIPMPQPRLRG